MIVREHIPKAELSDDQRRKLKLVNDNDLRSFQSDFEATRYPARRV